jgi:hypothetical protein
MRFFIPLLIGGACMLVCRSCSTCSRQQTVEDVTIDLADLAIDSTYVNLAQKVFYALPTPVEMSMMIKASGITYQPALLNNPGNASKYLTNREMALNFGVYVTDLTYAGLFEQSQTVLRYKQAIQQLTEGLGLQSAIDANTIQLLEANVNNRDEMMRIISDVYASCTASLNENDRYFLTLDMLLGGWVEGMYIATGMTDEKLVANENRMKQLVIDQKLTFDLIWRAMAELKDAPELAGRITELTDLAQLFDKVNVSQTPNTVTPSADGKTANIESSSIHNVTPELYSKIRDQIQTLRHNFTKK